MNTATKLSFESEEVHNYTISIRISFAICLGIGYIIATPAISWPKEWHWKPCLTSFTYSRNQNASQTIHLFGQPGISGDPSIVIDVGDKLRIERISCALLPTRRVMGVDIIKFKDFADIPGPPAAYCRIYLRATVRKYWGMKPKEEWYDEKNGFLSQWFQVYTEEREISDFHPTWYIGENWDYLRIQILPEPNEPQESKVISETLIALKPSTGRLKWNIRHNIFNWIYAEHPRVVKIFFGFTGVLLLAGLLVIVIIVVIDICNLRK